MTKRFTIEKKYWKTLPQGDYLKDNLTGESEFGIERFCEIANELQKENEQLKERNQRQAKRLAELYELMAKKDWESLTEIIDDFCSCEEQLQWEWKCY